MRYGRDLLNGEGKSNTVARRSWHVNARVWRWHTGLLVLAEVVRHLQDKGETEINLVIHDDRPLGKSKGEKYRESWNSNADDAGMKLEAGGVYRARGECGKKWSRLMIRMRAVTYCAMTV